MKRLIIGLSGASGAPLAVTLLKKLQHFKDIESHLICSKAAELTLTHETGLNLDDLKQYVHKIYSNDEIGSAPASGSFNTLGMIVIPCSMKTIAGIATGYSDSLLLRSADVTLKERRKLILVPRESPFSTLHLRNMTTLSELGAIIVPPVPAYYNMQNTIEDLNDYIALKVLTLIGLDTQTIEWRGL